MALARKAQTETPAIARPRVAPATVQRSAVGAAHSAGGILQGRLGNRGTHAFLEARLSSRVPSLQPKLAVSTPGDSFEREADRVADQVMRMADPSPQEIQGLERPPLQRICVECEEGETKAVQRKCGPCAAEEEGAVQRKAEGAAPAEATPDLANLRGGAPLSPEVRAFFGPRFGRDLSAVRVHDGAEAASAARSIHALAYTVGTDIVFGAGQYGPSSEKGRQLIAHELTHVVQQAGAAPPSVQRFHLPHGTDPEHKKDERPLIAPTFNAMMNTIKAIVAAATPHGTVNMDLFVKKAGGRSVMDKLRPKSVDKVAPMLKPRYLFTCRCGLIDLRHFLQLMYISNFKASAGLPARDANRSATRMGREHELQSEPESRFGPEDTASNAMGAFTGKGLAVYPQESDLVAAIEATLQRCDPVDFSSLGAASQDKVVHHYGDLIADPAAPANLIPAHQNQTAVPDILGIPECGGKERSFPFVLDTSDSDRKTISDTNFAKGSRTLTSDSEIRDFVFTQRAEVIKDLVVTDKVRLVRRLFDGWVSDEDLDAIEVIYNNAGTYEKLRIAASIDPTDLVSDKQQARLERLFK